MQYTRVMRYIRIYWYIICIYRSYCPVRCSFFTSSFPIFPLYVYPSLISCTYTVRDPSLRSVSLPFICPVYSLSLMHQSYPSLSVATLLLSCLFLLFSQTWIISMVSIYQSVLMVFTSFSTIHLPLYIFIYVYIHDIY